MLDEDVMIKLHSKASHQHFSESILRVSHEFLRMALSIEIPGADPGEVAVLGEQDNAGQLLDEGSKKRGLTYTVEESKSIILCCRVRLNIYLSKSKAALLIQLINYTGTPIHQVA